MRRPAQSAHCSNAAAIGVMRQVASLPLSSSQRVVTVEVGEGDSRRWLVLGVTPQNISMLHSMEPSVNAQPAPAPATIGFPELLRRLRQDKGAGQ